MASTFSINLGLEEPALGDYVNSWSTPVNANWSALDASFGDSITYPVTGGSLTLSTAQSVQLRIILTGVLTANQTVILPAMLGGRKYFYNLCTGGYTVTVKNGPSDSRGGVPIPYGLYCPILLVQGFALYDNYQAVPAGTIHCYAGTTAPSGFFLCNGASLAASTYGDLFNAIGYNYGGSGANFNIPDTRGRLLAGADNMGGTAAGRLTGYTLATTGGEQTHLLVTGEMPTHAHGVNDPGHSHGVTDPGHFHTINADASGTGGTNAVVGTNFNTTPTSPPTNNSTTGLTVNSATTGITTQNIGGGGAHNNIQPTIAINHIIRW